MIRSFQCKKTERLWNRERVKGFESIESVALGRLTALDSAQTATRICRPCGLDARPKNAAAVGVKEVRELLRSNEILDAKTMIGYLYWARL